jgi:CheY-like chemotaxis protein
MEVKWGEYNINKQLDYFYSFFKLETDKKGLDFSIKKSRSENESVIKTDKDKLDAIFANLIKNAIKYTNTGFIELSYTFNNNEVEFLVKDSGIGIGKEKQEVVFQRFIQEDISSTKPYEGAGLGLSIVKGYVEMMGGKIWLESEKGKGSSFFFTIPLRETKSEKDENMETYHHTKEKSKILKDLSILIAEDDPVGQDFLKELLADKCKTLVVADNGKKAVEYYKKNAGYDVVLMDIKMPVMDGYSATIKIKEFDAEAFIIAQTAYALESDKQKALAAGCDGYLTKPLNESVLIEKILERFN